MSQSDIHTPDFVTPSAEDTRIAIESCKSLSRLNPDEIKECFQIQIRSKDSCNEVVKIPDSALRLLSNILKQMAKGNTFALLSSDAELTTQQAADILNVSRPFLIDLLNQGLIPFYKVGTHRRINVQDVINYKKKIDQERLKALEELAAQAQELDMGY